MKRIIPLLILISLFWVSCSLGTGQADIVNIIVEESVENIIYETDLEELSISSLRVGGSSATITLPDLDYSIYSIIALGNDVLLNSSWSDDIMIISDLSAETNYTFMIYALGTTKNQMLRTAFTTLAEGEAEEEYITIGTREELATIGNDYNLSGNYLLIEDIDLSGENWTPIGDNSDPFTGCFEGSNHVISNLTIDNSTEDYQGLFGYAGEDASICNLGLEEIDVTGDDDTGGLVGGNDGSITSCYSTGTVTGASDTGGLVGYNDSGSITSCYSTGAVTGTSSNGGLVGCSSGIITSCYSTGAVTGTSFYTGGLVGYNSSFGSITSCYSTGAVTGTGVYIGGLVGYSSGNITSCYSIGAVSGTGNYTGSLLGENAFGSITSCYYDTETSGKSEDYNSYGTPLSTADMKLKDSYNADDWDFTTTWALDSSEAINSGYPYLMNLIPAE